MDLCLGDDQMLASCTVFPDTSGLPEAIWFLQDMNQSPGLQGQTGRTGVKGGDYGLQEGTSSSEGTGVQ